MKSEREHNLDELKRFVTNDEACHRVLEEAQAMFAKGAMRTEVDGFLTARLGELALEIRLLGGAGNNKNYVIFRKESPDERLVIQVCRKSTEAVKADETLSAAGKQNWQADCCFQIVTPATDGLGVGDMVYLRAIEFCPRNLGNLIEELDQSDKEMRISFAKSVGMQLSDMLTKLRENNLIWTDMKPGNLLLRQGGGVVIADTKCIIDPESLPKRLRKSNTLVYGDLSEPYLSEDFLMYRQTNTKDANEAKEIWEHEYSYQLAVTLHGILTASQPRLSQRGGNTSFNFDHEIFKTESGQRLQYIISSLGHENPLYRMHHTDAAALLKLVYFPKLFPAKQAEVERHIQASRANAIRGVRVGSRTEEEARKELDAIHRIQIANARHMEEIINQRLAADEPGLFKKIRKSGDVLRKSGEAIKAKVKRSPKEEHIISEPQKGVRWSDAKDVAPHTPGAASSPRLIRHTRQASEPIQGSPRDEKAEAAKKSAVRSLRRPPISKK